MDKLKINFLNHTLWGRGDQKLKEMLWEEHRLLPESSLINTVDKICAQYKIPAVSRMLLDKTLIKRQVRLMEEKSLNVGTKVKISKKKLYFFFSKPL